MITQTKVKKGNKRVSFKRKRIWLPFFILGSLFEQISQFRLPRWNQELLKTESFIERRMFYALKAAGYDIVCQVPSGRYRIDLAIPKYRIAIECDGHRWHSKPKDKARDRRKDKHLESEGWHVFRFTGREINFKLWWCMKVIYIATGRTPWTIFLWMRYPGIR
ncbi:endonuclease domain-containing protein [Hazenella coriacea]|uniref:Uncharacterized protein DUF559 n=1 Tax=Hazenella coriacea TaxID=1179467 RepID=A0A4R3L321_9BACL|nr:DUF559 domain-containing protein [Hazenella coriacea]TCS93622.1 uncharacterized protein DUF559 [Hazenella coriacea]